MEKEKIIESFKALSNNRLSLIIILGLLLALILLPGYIRDDKPVLLIDYAHGEIFMPLDPRELGYSELNKVFEEKGYELKVTSDPLTEKDLSQANVYLLAGPMQGLSEEERKAVRSYVEQGGKVVVLTHISMPLSEFLDDYSISMGWVLAEEENTLERPHDFIIKNIGDNEIFKGVNSLSFYGAFSVQSPMRYAVTSDMAWEDFNMNGVWDEGEPKGQFALIGMAEHGRGHVLTIGDDAVLANYFIGEEDNLKLAQNIAEWGLR